MEEFARLPPSEDVPMRQLHVTLANAFRSQIVFHLGSSKTFSLLLEPFAALFPANFSFLRVYFSPFSPETCCFQSAAAAVEQVDSSEFISSSNTRNKNPKVGLCRHTKAKKTRQAQRHNFSLPHFLPSSRNVAPLDSRALTATQTKRRKIAA
jgi:hypothetical protein